MYRRFTTFERTLHGIMILSFFTLAITGMILKFSYMGWAQLSGSLLGGFAVITTAAIAATYLGTRDAIVVQERAARAKALLEIVPRKRHDNNMLDNSFDVDDHDLLGLDAASPLFVASRNGEAVAFIIPSVAPDGYSGAITLFTGVNTDGSVAGVRVISHNETPGLGDKVDLKKSAWILSFNGTSLREPKPEQWGVKRDGGAFDQFTGATITPRAVTRSVYQTLVYFQANRQSLLERWKAAGVPPASTPPKEPSEENQDG